MFFTVNLNKVSTYLLNYVSAKIETLITIEKTTENTHKQNLLQLEKCRYSQDR